MTLRDAVFLAVSALRGSIVKTLLTILGLAVGVGAVLTVLELGAAGEIRVEAEIARMGVDKVWIRPADSSHVLHQQDSALLYEATQAPACAGIYTAAAIQYDWQNLLAQIAGFDESMSSVHQPKILDGRVFTKAEFQQGSPVCLVDAAMAQALGKDIIGQWLTIANRRFRVLGVIKSLTPQTMAAGNGLIVLPLNTYLSTFGGNVAEITLSVQSGQSTENVAAQALAVLTTNGYRADTLKEEITAAREIVRIFVMVLLCVAVVCMLTGTIGVMNVLLINVRERRHEIGLMKALGSTNMQLGFLFILESLAYAVIGTFLGIMLSLLMLYAFGSWIGFSAALSLGKLLPVILAAAALGICAGVAPALSAAALQPVDALNCE